MNTPKGQKPKKITLYCNVYPTAGKGTFWMASHPSSVQAKDNSGMLAIAIAVPLTFTVGQGIRKGKK